MNTRRLARHAVTTLAALAIGVLAGPVLAQPYPNRVIKLIVPFSPGGQPDTIARIIAQHLSVSVGTTIIDNRPGANTTIGAKAAIAADPDGYTLFFGTSTSLAIVPATKPGEYDPIKTSRRSRRCRARPSSWRSGRRCRRRPSPSSSPMPRPIRAS